MENCYRKEILHQFSNIPYFLQMDSQNKELVHENELLQEQVDILRERLQALPALASKEIFRLSQQVRNFITSCRWNTLIACKWFVDDCYQGHQCNFYSFGAIRFGTGNKCSL